jgi:Domain of unknown function (DUF4267)
MSKSKRFSRENIGSGLAALTALGIIYVGARFILDPSAAASGFGVPSRPHGQAAAYLDIKGVRDIASGLVVLALLAAGHCRALGLVMLVYAIIPAGDATIVLTHGGHAATAFGIHGSTVVVLLVSGCLLLVGRRDHGGAPGEGARNHRTLVSAQK